MCQNEFLSPEGLNNNSPEENEERWEDQWQDRHHLSPWAEKHIISSWHLALPDVSAQPLNDTIPWY